MCGLRYFVGRSLCAVGMGHDSVTGMDIDLDLSVNVDFERDEPFEEMSNGKYYPITIKRVKFRGQDISHLLHISHVMQIQRRVYNRIINHMLATNTVATKQGDMEI